MGIEVPTVVDALFPGGKPLPAWGTGGDTVAALAVDLPSEAAEGCGVSLVFSISSSVSIGGGSGGVLLFNALWERGGYHPVWCHFHEFLRNRAESEQSSARSLFASKSQNLRADGERAERKKQKKQSYARCDTQQLEGEAQDKSERVTSVSMVTKLVPANDEASAQRANREKTAA